MLPGLLVLLGFVLLALAGCGPSEPEVDPDELVMSQTAYESLLEAIPDTVLAGRGALDSLFLDHDFAVFQPHPYDSVAASRWVDSMMAALTWDEKIGQLFIVHLPRSGLRILDDDAREAVVKHGVGGFLVPRLLGPEKVYEETQRLQKAARVPLFFAADYERGVGRFNNAFTELPSNMALGATRDTLLAAAAGRLTALEARSIGVNLLLAPVVDINNNPDNPIINIRSYGEDPMLVAHMAGAFVREAQRFGLLTTLKHFPGHGNTSVDSHARMGTVEGDLAAIDSVELRPYHYLLGNPDAPAGVMSAHLWAPALDDDPLPATFSRQALTNLLRNTLGFEGFVVTDDIKMGALQNQYSDAERIVTPLQVGADIILTPADLPRAKRFVQEALQQGDLTEANLNESVRRILTAKARAGLHRHRLVDASALDHLLEKPRGAYLAQAIADRAVTLLKDDGLLPLDPTQRLAVIHLANVNGSESIDAAMDFFTESLGAVADVRLGREPSSRAVDDALAKARNADVVVLALYLRLEAGRGEAGLFARQDTFVRQLLDTGTPVVLVTFGNPYAVVPFAGAEVLLVAYEQSIESVAAAAGILQGLQPATGTLPITVAPYAYGSGLPGPSSTPAGSTPSDF